MRARAPLIVGNWKMHGRRESLQEIDAIALATHHFSGVTVVVCPPLTLIESASTRSDKIGIGAQDCHREISGAFTGQVSADMLFDVGARFVILGHSECREGFGETDADVRLKVERALAAGLKAIVCVGETANARDAGQEHAVVAAQLRGSLPGRFDDNLIVAYEPVWAIGTGTTPSVRQIEMMHESIRAVLFERFGPEGESLSILYGGSANSANARHLLSIDGVDGLLVGGASRTANTFVPIVEDASRIAEARAAPTLAAR